MILGEMRTQKKGEKLSWKLVLSPWPKQSQPALDPSQPAHPGIPDKQISAAMESAIRKTTTENKAAVEHTTPKPRQKSDTLSLAVSPKSPPKSLPQALCSVC